MPHNDATAMATATTASTAGQKPVPRETVTRSKHVPREYECKKKKKKLHLNGIVFYVNYAHCIFFA